MNPAPIKPLISTSYLDKIDVRVGTILAVEDVAHSEKLVRLRVDFGDHARSILVGMKKERPSPKEIEGRQALFVVNLAAKGGGRDFRTSAYYVALPFVAADDGVAPMLQRERGSDGPGGALAETWLCRTSSRGRSTGFRIRSPCVRSARSTRPALSARRRTTAVDDRSGSAAGRLNVFGPKAKGGSGIRRPRWLPTPSSDREIARP
jgi:hypothetical protein